LKSFLGFIPTAFAHHATIPKFLFGVEINKPLKLKKKFLRFDHIYLLFKFRYNNSKSIIITKSYKTIYYNYYKTFASIRNRHFNIIESSM